ncbi:ABC transporter permease [Caulobacter sp. LjRoot300]|uniref:ABC transporter permease n=1 Tax=Caulobacter sp. LjRoot300 TaxID=3342321 RepID=UPI003ECE5C38
MRRLLNVRPRGGLSVLLGLLPLLAVALVYLMASQARHAENPRDKLLPTPTAMVEAVQLMAKVDPLTGDAPLVVDTVASLKRIGVALVIATGTTLVLGLGLGLLPLLRAKFGPLVAAIAVVPPIAVLPILFIVFGLGETAKIALIVIGVTPVMVRDLAAHVAAIPEEQLVKAQTLGSSTWQLALRLSLCPAWVYLISAEAIAADVGLGYRIFLVRRYMSMDIILPYVLWISILAVAMDVALKLVSRRAYPWAHPAKGR